MHTQITDIHPRLKIGARPRVHTRLSDISSQVEPILTFLDGNHDIDDISQRSGLPPSRVEWLIHELHQAALIDIRESSLVVRDHQMTKVQARAMRSKRSVPDARFRQLQKRVTPELALITWRDGVDDGGVEMLSARQRYEVEVTGISRMLPSVLAILRSSGVTQSHVVITARNERDTIDVDDLAAGIFDITDIGGQYFARLNERLKSHSLFGAADEQENQAFLRIHFGTPSLEQSAQWAQHGEPYLIVREPSAGEISIGPLVLPHMTACHRCADVALRENGEYREALSGYDIPVAQSHLVAGFIADQILRFIDTGISEIVGAEITLDFLSPLHLRRREIPRHPLCGCSFQE